MPALRNNIFPFIFISIVTRNVIIVCVTVLTVSVLGYFHASVWSRLSVSRVFDDNIYTMKLLYVILQRSMVGMTTEQ